LHLQSVKCKQSGNCFEVERPTMGNTPLHQLLII